MIARLFRSSPSVVTRVFLADSRNKRFHNQDNSFGSSRKSQRSLCALRSFGRISSQINQQREVTMMASGVNSNTQTYQFGPFTIRETEVFAVSRLSLALVNLKPVVQGNRFTDDEQAFLNPPKLVCPKREPTDIRECGCRSIHIGADSAVERHVLIVPRRVVRRFQELSPEEVTDLWMLAQRVGSKIEPHFQASALTMAIQDGPAAGQTVPHVHIHILPRKVGDFENNDEIYDKIDEHAERMREKLDLDKERRVRTPDEMAHEASELRALFDDQPI